MLVFVDPFPEKGHSIHFVQDEDAVRISRKVALKEFVCKADALPPNYTNAQALQDFQITHWADTIEETIEKMAKAMWMHWAKQSSGMPAVCTWEQVVREGWREQAKAALKSLGVPL